jgi:hypothetical protein
MKFTTLLCALASSVVLAAPVMKPTADHSNASISLPTVVQNLEKRTQRYGFVIKRRLAAFKKRNSDKEACNSKGKTFIKKYSDVRYIGRFNVGRCSTTMNMTIAEKAEFEQALADKRACLAKGAKWIGDVSKRGRCSE